jgi:hypothetical protein
MLAPLLIVGTLIRKREVRVARMTEVRNVCKGLGGNLKETERLEDLRVD